MVIILINRDIRLTQDGSENVIVTRPCLLGGIALHTFKSPEYSIFAMAEWLYHRYVTGGARLVQDAFPNMKADEREFLMTGITPTKWTETFKDGDE